MARLKKYRVQKRFEVWLEAEVMAKDFTSAVEHGRAMGFSDFMVEGEDSGVLDVTDLGGFSTAEQW